MTHAAAAAWRQAAGMGAMTMPVNGWHWREWAAEAAGTGLLMFAVVSAKDLIVRAGGPVSEIWIRVALVGVVAGLVVIAVAYSPLGRRSGAHLNPAVTLGLAAQGSVGAADAICYPLAQAAGGIAGVVAARVCGPTVVGPAVRWAVIAPAGWLGQPAGAAIEAVATGIQLAVVFGCLTSARWRSLAPAAAAILLAGAIAVLAPVSGAGFNPVRGLAPDVPADTYPALWIYFAGPLAGALAVGMAIRVRGRWPKTGKLVHNPAIACYMRCELPHLAASGVTGADDGRAFSRGTGS
jgi:aquaporin Z